MTLNSLGIIFQVSVLGYYGKHSTMMETIIDQKCILMDVLIEGLSRDALRMAIEEIATGI